MQRRVFLSGEGAYELLCDMLSDRLDMAGGYITRPCTDADGSSVGEELLPAAAAAGIEGFTGARYLSFAGGELKKDNEVFRTQAVRLLEEAQYYPYALLSELGGFEIVIPQYRAALSALLSSSLPCVGVLKSMESAQMLGRFFGLGERYSTLLRQLHTALQNDPDTLVLSVEEGTEARARAAIDSWKRAFLT